DRISRNQRVPVALPGVLAIDAQTFRGASQENVATDAVTRQQPRRRFAHRAEPLEAQLQSERELFRAWILLLLFRQQQGRLQVGKPGCHHQIIGSYFKLKRLGLVDVGYVLVDQREDRDGLEIDLLPPRQVQQQVERTLPTVKFEIKGCVGRRRRAGAFPVFTVVAERFEQQPVGHAITLTRPRSASRFAASSARSAPLDASVAASARSRRAVAPSERSGSRAAISTMSSIRAQQLSTRSQPAAIARSARSGTLPESASMSMSSVRRRPVKPILSRIT